MITKIQLATGKIKHFRLKVIVAIILIVCVCASSAIAEANIVTTKVIYNGTTQEVSTFSSNPYDIVAKTDFEISPDDKIDLSAFDVHSGESTISITKACEVLFYDEGEFIKAIKFSGTVSEALKKAGIKLDTGDKVNKKLSDEVSNGMNIKITRAFGVTLVVNKETYRYNVTSGTVQDILDMAKVKIGKDDKISVKPSAKLKAKMKIKVSKAKYKEYTQEVSIPFETKTEYSSSLYRGEMQVTQEGVKGVKTEHYKQTIVNGKVTKDEFIRSEVTKKPVKKIVVYGTKEKVTVTKPVVTAAASKSAKVISELKPTIDIKLDANGRPINYKKVLTGSATAYYGGYSTATGQKPMPGRIAVNPKQIPYGTKMYIVSSDGKFVYGYCEASDTGGFANTGRTIADLYFNTYNECCQFGRRNVEIYIF